MAHEGVARPGVRTILDRQQWSKVTMALVRYEPWSVLNQLHGQINRILERELDQGASSAVTADWIPPADIEEYGDRFVLKLDVPGVDVAAIDITLDKGV